MSLKIIRNKLTNKFFDKKKMSDKIVVGKNCQKDIIRKKRLEKISENLQKNLIGKMMKENCHKNYQNNCEKIIARKNFPKNF